MIALTGTIRASVKQNINNIKNSKNYKTAPSTVSNDVLAGAQHD